MKRPIIILVVVSVIFGVMTPLTVDYYSLWLAGMAILQGGNPYAPFVGFYNPLYVAWAYAPLSLLPFEIAYHIQAGLMLFVYVLALWRLLRRRDLFLICVAAPFALATALYGNIEGVVLLGATLPAPIGLWLVMSKPQIGIVVAAVMLWRECRENGVRRAILIAFPLVAAFFVSIWAGMLRQTPASAAWNVSIWPVGIILGLPLALYAIHKRDVKIGLLASALAAPYLTQLSWGVIQPALSRSRRLAILLTLVCWVYYLIYRFG